MNIRLEHLFYGNSSCRFCGCGNYDDWRPCITLMEWAEKVANLLDAVATPEQKAAVGL